MLTFSSTSGLSPRALVDHRGTGLARRVAHLAFALTAAASASTAGAATALQHTGATNPIAEGFFTTSFQASSSVGPLFDDLGLAAWSITNNTLISQFGYASGGLTADQKASLQLVGFDLSFKARVIQGATPAVYDDTNHVTLSNVGVDTGARRYEVALGLDAGGNTVAVLPSSVDNFGPGNSLRTPGAQATLGGNGYHLYQLILNPATQLADLYVDGTARLFNYAGHNSFVRDNGLIMAGNSGSTANFSTVQLSMVPEPATLPLLMGGLFVMGFLLARRRRS